MNRRVGWALCKMQFERFAARVLVRVSFLPATPEQIASKERTMYYDVDTDWYWIMYNAGWRKLG